MARQAKSPPAPPRISVTEWIASGVGLVLSLGVIGYTVWEGVTETHGPPELRVSSQSAQAVAGGFVVPIVVGNTSRATAADVRVAGVLEGPAGVVETRRATFAYVPGRGEVKGGLIFRHNPSAYRLRVEAEGFEEP